MAPEEKSPPVREIDQLLAALENTRREMEETWGILERSSPELPPAADAVPPAPPPPAPVVPPAEASPAAPPAPSNETLRERARDEGYEARRRLLRKLFLRLRDERQRLDDVRRDLRVWTEQLSSRYGALAKAENEFNERRNRLEEERLRRQEETLRDERRRFEEERLRFDRERLEDDRRRAALAASVPTPPPPPAPLPVPAAVPVPEPAAPPPPAAAEAASPAPAAGDEPGPAPWGAALKNGS